MPLDEGPNVLFKLAGGGVDTSAPLFAGKFGEPAFDLVEGNREDHVGWQAQVPLGVGSPAAQG